VYPEPAHRHHYGVRICWRPASDLASSDLIVRCSRCASGPERANQPSINPRSGKESPTLAARVYGVGVPLVQRGECANPVSERFEKINCSSCSAMTRAWRCSSAM
jgi:hypothetical protein